MWSSVVLCIFLLTLTINPTLGTIIKKKSKNDIPTIPFGLNKTLSPVIFVPGDGGSQLDALLNKSEVVHYICQKQTTDYFNIWLNLQLLVPVVIDCWIDNVRLIYDNVTRTTSNSPGVQIRVPGWGDPEVVEWLDPSHASAGTYFKDIGNALVSIGYERRKNIFGAPYDFRKAPNENKQWFLDLKILVEEAYTNNNNTPVTFIVHSMGGPMTLVFLQGLSAEWKSKYISRVISLSGAWAGSAKAIKVYAIGDDLGSFALNGKVMRTEQITSPSLAWLMPNPLFWKPDEVLVSTTERTYTMSQLEEFFRDINYPTGWEMRKDTLKYTDFSPPGVELHCLFGSSINTVEKLHYNKQSITDGSPNLIYGDGDGTVNIRSLEACKHWTGMKGQNNKNISLLSLPGVDHMTILNHDKVINYILSTLVG